MSARKKAVTFAVTRIFDPSLEESCCIFYGDAIEDTKNTADELTVAFGSAEHFGVSTCLPPL